MRLSSLFPSAVILPGWFFLGHAVGTLFPTRVTGCNYLVNGTVTRLVHVHRVTNIRASAKVGGLRGVGVRSSFCRSLRSVLCSARRSLRIGLVALIFIFRFPLPSISTAG